MAKVRFGAIVSGVSGSISGNTFSHNKGGPYIRNRTVPTKSTTTAAQAAKARLAAQSIAWQGLTQAQRDSWKHWSEHNPVIDRLGEQRNLTGHQSFIKLNTRIDLIGETPLTAPPILAAPDALVTLVPTVDIGVGNTELVYTTTPLAAGIAVYCWADIVDSAGINYVENGLRYFMVSPAAQASPLDIESELAAVFGTPVEDQTVHFSVSTIRLVDGQISVPIKARTLVVDTT